MGYTKDEILHRLRYQPPSSSFRAGYAYTNFGFSEAGYAAAKAIDADWNAVAADRLFKPLGMNSTSYQFADYEKAKNRAKIHVLVDGKWTPKYTRQPDAQAPAGGASSTIKDLAQWMRLHLAEGKFNGKEVVKADALAETHTPQFVTGFTPAEGRIGGYGLGWNVNDERGGLITLNHSGEFSLGVRSQVALIPIEGLGITILSNGAPTGVPEGISQSFFDYVLDGELQRDWMTLANQKFEQMTQDDKDQLADYSHPPSDRAAPLNLKVYVGKYQNKLYGVIEIAEKQGGLVLRSGPKLNECKLRHWDRDLFTFEPTGESAAGTAGVMFTIGPEGKAERVSVENLNLNGQGVFEKVD
jgi:CubicO group peptidase (beta-lactamase class C family)